MPGLADWRAMYRMEYVQLFDEGYPVGSRCTPDLGEPYIPLPVNQRGKAALDALGEAGWEQAYRRLWEVREQGLRKGFAFVEPNDVESILADSPPAPVLAPLSAGEYTERIAGAWWGRVAGVTLGRPVEMWRTADIEAYLKAADAYPLTDYIPLVQVPGAKMPNRLKSMRGHIEHVPLDDDVAYTVAALRLVEERGCQFSKVDVVRNWVSRFPYECLYSCTKQAYYNWVRRPFDIPVEEYVEQLPLMDNPMREGLNASIRADMYGYIAPGDPQRAARIAYQDSSVNSVKNGIYAALFTVGCISAALSRNPTVATILAGGLSAVPRRSRLAHAIAQVRRWYAAAGAWEPVADQIHATYGHLNRASAMYNFPITTLALLHGELDFGRTIATAVMCGVDTDCTAGTAGSIVGAAVGEAGIDPRWITPFQNTVRTFVAGNGDGDNTMTDLIRRTIACRVRG